MTVVMSRNADIRNTVHIGNRDASKDTMRPGVAYEPQNFFFLFFIVDSSLLPPLPSPPLSPPLPLPLSLSPHPLRTILFSTTASDRSPCRDPTLGSPPRSGNGRSPRDELFLLIQIYPGIHIWHASSLLQKDYAAMMPTEIPSIHARL